MRSNGLFPPVLALALSIAMSSLASGAELPSRESKPVPAAKRCQISGAPGFFLPDSDTCVKVSGFITAHGVYGAPANPR